MKRVVHTAHCDARRRWGDGECECQPRPPRPTDRGGLRRLTVWVSTGPGAWWSATAEEPIGRRGRR